MFRFATTIGLALGLVLVGSGAATSAADVIEVQDVASNVELAQAFTAALNTHDADALVELFTDEDGGPTVNADRFAWQKFEIRVWALQQVAANVHADAYDYETTDFGATWNADMFRADWSLLGAQRVRVTNSIWVHHGRVADFTSRLSDPSDQLLLGQLWQPGTAPPLSGNV
jgi:hypothetical protein